MRVARCKKDVDYESCSRTQVDVIFNVKHVVKGLTNRGLEVRHDQMDLHGTQQTLD
jgi:hypothetical protein